MKRLLTIVLIMIALTGNSQTTTPDFRNLNWGMTQQQVKAKETSLKFAQSNKESMVYQGSILNTKCMALYSFVDNQLSSAFIDLQVDNVSKNKYVEDYYGFQKQLTSKYGKADEEEIRWRDNLYKDDPDHIGMAISAEHVVYKTVWYKGGTIISLIMKGKDFEISIYLLYQGYDLMKKENEQQSKKEMDEI